MTRRSHRRDEERDSGLPFEEFELGDHVYRIYMLPMGKWLQLKEIVFRTFGPPLAEMIAKGDWSAGLKSIADLDPRALGGAVLTLSQRLGEREMRSILELLAPSTRVDGRFLAKGGGYGGIHWSKNMGSLGPYLVQSLIFQFSDFFGGLVAVIPRSAQATEEDEGSRDQSLDVSTECTVRNGSSSDARPTTGPPRRLIRSGQDGPFEM